MTHPAILTLLLLSALPTLPAQAPKPATLDPASAATWFPLVPGQHSTWRIEESDWDEGGASFAESIVWGEVPLDATKTCTQVLSTSAWGADHSYWRADATGLWQFAQADATLRGPGRTATLWIPGPIGSVKRWEWDEAPPGPAGADAKSAPTPKIHHVGTLLAMDERITVPFGTYSTLHVKFRSTGAREMELDQWFAPGIGLVQSESRSPSFPGRAIRRLTRQLHSMVPGTAAPDHATLLKNVLGVHHDAPTTWLPLGAIAYYLPGRFAVVRPRTGGVSCWFLSDQARPLGSDDLATWRHVLAEAVRARPRFANDFGRDAGPLQIAGEPAVLAFAGLVARVECARRGLAIVSITEHGVTNGERANQRLSTAREAVVATLADGSKHELTVVVEQLGADLTAIQVTSAVPAPAPAPLGPGPRLR